MRQEDLRERSGCLKANPSCHVRKMDGDRCDEQDWRQRSFLIDVRATTKQKPCRNEAGREDRIEKKKEEESETMGKWQKVGKERSSSKAQQKSEAVAQAGRHRERRNCRAGGWGRR